MAEAKKAGGPTVHTRQTLPDWDGWYQRGAPRRAVDLGTQPADGDDAVAADARVPEAHGADELPRGGEQLAAVDGAFCYPEGFMRWWAEASLGGPIEVMMTPNQVQFLTGIADNLLRRVLIGRKHVQKVPQWFGETVGFWNGNTLVAWTANVQGWTLSHSMFEFSSKMETIEMFTPSADGKTITVEATFYDPEAFIAAAAHGDAVGAARAVSTIPSQRFTFVECRVQSTIVNGPDGRPTQLTFVDAGLHRLLRPAVGAELGRAFRAGLEEARRTDGRERHTAKLNDRALRRPSAYSSLACDLDAVGPRASLIRDVRHDRRASR